MLDTSNAYLICDLDGTLLKKDFFVQQLIRSVFTNPKTIIYAAKGLVPLKHFILDDLNPDISHAINYEVVELIKTISARFKAVLLISASTDAFTKKIASEFSFFDEGHGTTNINLKGVNKLNFIKQKGYEPFVYIGDSNADNVLFKNALYYYKIINNKPMLVK